MGLETTCCVVGGGPAGVMLGYLLARRGIRVTVIEKHNDFFRDFRGDTVHPSTLEVLDELGLLEDFLALPHQKSESAGGVLGDYEFVAADFRHVPARCRFVAFLPQWDFLNFLAGRARQYSTFDLRMGCEATGLIREGNSIVGVTARGPGQETVEIRALLVVGCDGRHSVTRTAGELELEEFGVPMDVLWFRISRRPDDPDQVFGQVNYGRLLILIDRGSYFQAGFIVPKGAYDEIRGAGIQAFRDSIGRMAPFLEERTGEIESFEQVRILTVQLNRLKRWYRDGLLCIGDAAHAMSPVGGVGINLAIQDAVAAANLLVRPLREGRSDEAVLAPVQERRQFPTVVTQAFQTMAHRGLGKVFGNPGPLHAPWQFRAAMHIPGLHAALGYLIGIGVRPEHAKRRPARPSGALAMGVGAALGFLAASVVMRKSYSRS